MNILVYNVAASSGGALSVLRDFYRDVRMLDRDDLHWYFVVSTPVLEETEHITVLRFPKVKRSWMHRLVFEYFAAPGFIKRYGIDRVFSMQNICMPRVKAAQIVYIHSPLPFTDYKVRLKESPNLWIYQNILGYLMKRSLKIADKVVVQTEWMKEACLKYTAAEKIIISKPNIKEEIGTYADNYKNRRVFFYPASSWFYKNHEVLLKACKKLKEESEDFQLILTLTGKENKVSQRLYEYSNKYQLPVVFAGSMDRTEVLEWYTKSVLVFPSFIETFGLPMLEAAMSGSFICASDRSFSREILDGYKNVEFFHYQSADELKEAMKRIMHEREYQKDKITIEETSLIEDICGLWQC